MIVNSSLCAAATQLRQGEWKLALVCSWSKKIIATGYAIKKNKGAITVNMICRKNDQEKVLTLDHFTREF
jgi:hypothetical protein